MSTLAERLNRFEAELRRMDTELRELRREVPAEERATEAPPAATATTLQAPLTPPPPRPSTPPARPLAPSVRPARPQPRRPRVDVGGLVARLDLLGAGGLAVVGGAVTALGITLLFVLAAEQGWIGPVARPGPRRPLAGDGAAGARVEQEDEQEESTDGAAEGWEAPGGSSWSRRASPRWRAPPREPRA